MNEQSLIMSYIDKPFAMLSKYLARNGFKTISGQRDRERNLNKMTFMSHTKTSHLKVTVWHMWCTPDTYGVCKPGFVTDIEIRNLEPNEETRYVRPNR
jgi:hypothetical protein